MKVVAAALAAFFLAAPAGAQSLQDAVVDCKNGPRILKTCRVQCAHLTALYPRPYGSVLEYELLRQCRNRCWGIKVALEECSRR